MRLAYVTETWPPELNGVSLTVQRTVRFLRGRHAVHLVRPRQPHEAARDDPEELRVPGLPIPLYRDLRIGLPMRRALRSRWRGFAPALVHVATEGPLGWAAIAAARDVGAAVTSDFRTRFEAYSRYYGAAWAAPLVTGYLRRFHNRTDRTFVATRALADELGATGFERLSVVARGVDAQRFHPQARSAQVRAAWGAAHPDVPVLLSVGRLAAEKHVDWAVAAWQAVRERGLPARLVLVGDGPRRAALMRDHPQAIFTGTLHGDALAAAYASADVFLFPSTSETFGNVTLEAMASGLLLVAFDQAAAGALVRDGENGWLVRPAAGESPAAAFCRRVVHAVAALPGLGPVRAAARATAACADWEGVLLRFERALIDRAAARGADAHVAAYLAQQR